MAQNVPELELLSVLRDKFPEVTIITIMKLMKLYNNDTDKCIQALEQESQKSMFGVGLSSQSPEQNSHTSNHNNSASHSSSSYINSANRDSNSSIGSSSTMSVGQPRLELPVRHEQSSIAGAHHISTVQHTIAAPLVPKAEGVFSRPAVPPPVQTRTEYRPTLVIDPANRGHHHPSTAPVKSHDFSPFMETPTRTRTEIPNIRCNPPGKTSEGGVSGGSASGESPTEQRRPVRVINVKGQFFSGGTVTSRASPTGVTQGSKFRVRLKDGGGVCVSPAAMASHNNSSPASSSASFSSPSYAASAPETDQLGIHLSSIVIDNAVNSRRTNVQESVGDQSLSIHPNTYGGGGGHMMETQGPTSLPVTTRTMGPLSVSLSSHVSTVGPEGRMHSVVAYNPGWSVGGGRFAQEGVSPSPPRSSYPASMNVMDSLSLSPSQTSNPTSMYPGYPASTPNQTSSSVPTSMYPGFSGATPSLAQSMGYSPILPGTMHRSPSLQHQRSTGSSTSRSNSMDSEHGSIHLGAGSDYDQHTPPLPHQASPLLHRVGVSMMPMAVPVLSPSSSQSSLSSESSTRERDNPNAQRPRSGSMQEEAAYSQALLEHQRQRMRKLTEDIQQKRQLLERLRNDVSEMEKLEIGKNSARTTFPTPNDIAGLCESNRRLQTDIQMYLNELDMYRNGQTPFSVIDPMEQQNFYKNMPTGPNDLRYTKPSDRPRSPDPPPVPPPRPPPPWPPLRINSNDLTQPVPPPARGQITQGGGSGDSEEGDSWPCSACTFRNHPALKKCEMCEMPRIHPGS